MTKAELKEAVSEAKAATKTALETMYNALNQGQQKKILKDEKVKAQFDFYGVQYAE